MLDTIERPSTDKVTEPAKRWRNWYVATRHFGCAVTLRMIWEGERFPASKTWPSKEVAEQKHVDDAAKPNHAAFDCAEYLGAFPVAE